MQTSFFFSRILILASKAAMIVVLLGMASTMLVVLGMAKTTMLVVLRMALMGMVLGMMVTDREWNRIFYGHQSHRR